MADLCYPCLVNGEVCDGCSLSVRFGEAHMLQVYTNLCGVYTHPLLKFFFTSLVELQGEAVYDALLGNLPNFPIPDPPTALYNQFERSTTFMQIFARVVLNGDVLTPNHRQLSRQLILDLIHGLTGLLNPGGGGDGDQPPGDGDQPQLLLWDNGNGGNGNDQPLQPNWDYDVLDNPLLPPVDVGLLGDFQLGGNGNDQLLLGGNWNDHLLLDGNGNEQLLPAGDGNDQLLLGVGPYWNYDFLDNQFWYDDLGWYFGGEVGAGNVLWGNMIGENNQLLWGGGDDGVQPPVDAGLLGDFHLGGNGNDQLLLGVQPYWNYDFFYNQFGVDDLGWYFNDEVGADNVLVGNMIAENNQLLWGGDDGVLPPVNAGLLDDFQVRVNGNDQQLVGGNVNDQLLLGVNVNDQLLLGGNVNGQLLVGGNVNGQPLVGGNVNGQPLVGGNVNGQLLVGGNVNGQPLVGGNVNGQLLLGGNVNDQLLVGGNVNGQLLVGGNVNDQPLVGGNVNDLLPLVGVDVFKVSAVGAAPIAEVMNGPQDNLDGFEGADVVEVIAVGAAPVAEAMNGQQDNLEGFEGVDGVELPAAGAAPVAEPMNAPPSPTSLRRSARLMLKQLKKQGGASTSNAPQHPPANLRRSVRLLLKQHHEKVD